MLGARRCSGVDFVLKETGLAASLATARLVVVGEGSIDHQTLGGKAPAGIARVAASHSVPVVAVAGRVMIDASQLAPLGITASYAVADLAESAEESVADAARFLALIGEQIADDHLL
jgi:glycerate kinase